MAGKYRVEQVLGSGGMGLVLQAHHLQLDQRVAIKCLVTEALENTEAIERFSREARVAAKIQSEHVARILDVGSLENGLPYIVLEYLEGVDLAEYLGAKGPLRITSAVRYVLEACEALAEAHAAKIIHRDIKPANLFLAKQRDGRRIIKVLDFGISKLTDEPVTKTAALLGTAMYMSPEQLRNARDVDHRTDIWALGCVLYELLTGTAAFKGNSIVEVVASLAANKPKPIRELRPDVPEGIEAIVSRCLVTDPKGRYDNVLALALDLSQWAKSDDRNSIHTIRRVLGPSMAPPSSDSTPDAESGGVRVIVPGGGDSSGDDFDDFEGTQTQTLLQPATAPSDGLVRTPLPRIVNKPATPVNPNRPPTPNFGAGGVRRSEPPPADKRPSERIPLPNLSDTGASTGEKTPSHRPSQRPAAASTSERPPASSQRPPAMASQRPPAIASQRPPPMSEQSSARRPASPPPRASLAHSRSLGIALGLLVVAIAFAIWRAYIADPGPQVPPRGNDPTPTATGPQGLVTPPKPTTAGTGAAEPATATAAASATASVTAAAAAAAPTAPAAPTAVAAASGPAAAASTTPTSVSTAMGATTTTPNGAAAPDNAVPTAAASGARSASPVAIPVPVAESP